MQRQDAMTGTGVCGDVRQELGVYLLGSIRAADRSAVESHLACCADCRNMLAELAGLPGLLNRVNASDAGIAVGAGVAAAPEPERRDSVPSGGRRAVTGKQNRNSAR
jgi:anti-sigma factor RsiW